MGMTLGARRGGQAASINVTPMIDVLLVLLIIFMVLQDQLRRGLSLQVPPPRDSEAPPDPESLVLEVLPGGVYRLNQQPIAAGSLRRELGTVLDRRNRKVLFVKADNGIEYSRVLTAIDAARNAGVRRIGAITELPEGARVTVK